MFPSRPPGLAARVDDRPDGKPFLYLVQGRGRLPAHYTELESDRSDVIHLTWGEPVGEAIYHPGSTWAEGRNRLLEEALVRPERPLYYILLDDDVEFEKGGWRLFEDELLTYRPAVAAPFYPLYDAVVDPVPGVEAYPPRPGTDAQTAFWHDAMYAAFHRDVVADGLLLPYYTGMDHISWPISQWFVIFLARVLYSGHVLQFNRVWISNALHDNSYGTTDSFAAPFRFWITSVLKQRPVWARAWGRVLKQLGRPDFVPRPAPAPLDSYRLPARAVWKRLNPASAFWTDRRSAPQPEDASAQTEIALADPSHV